MMLKLIRAVAVIAFAAGLSAPAMAQAQSNPPAASQPQPGGPNPNEMICQKQEVTGSRLGVKRVCKTRAEWADFQLQERQQIEKVQVQRHMPGT
jgi:invasion protein IalB